MLRSVLFVFLSAISFSSFAGGVDQLKQFIAETRAAQADFTQVVLDQNGKRIQSASGIMQFQRPGKFRWEYKNPYEQIIVGDGEKFWLYDVDLEQVTVKKLDAALGSSPAALLSGDNEIERGFSLEDVAARDGLLWLQAIPKTTESSFEKVLMGFDSDAGLVVMELHDTFGNHTVLRFSDMQKNPKIPAQQFQFTPPDGVDVLGDG